ncbi:sigma intracellular receptor 2-like [Haliotis rubra]|uniref:sigma intracellular receptor 2-like n=1 Tax=Haliotis rubra TaxID=36100 RepID=UPI001EE5A520|nr:sigma intracellular receptor 2-like [Haliotis rubra]
MAGLRRSLDTLFIAFYVFEAVSTIFFDTQQLLPSYLYPKPLTDLFQWYTQHFRDPYMANARNMPWFASFCIVEFITHIPFFFFAIYAYYKGPSKCPWIRIPVIMYCVQIITFVTAVEAGVFFDDFSKSKLLAPRNLGERLKLGTNYSLFFFVPLTNLLDALFSSAYTPKVKAA